MIFVLSLWLWTFCHVYFVGGLEITFFENDILWCCRTGKHGVENITNALHHPNFSNHGQNLTLLLPVSLYYNLFAFPDSQHSSIYIYIYVYIIHKWCNASLSLIYQWNIHKRCNGSLTNPSVKYHPQMVQCNSFTNPSVKYHAQMVQWISFTNPSVKYHPQMVQCNSFTNPSVKYHAQMVQCTSFTNPSVKYHPQMVQCISFTI